MADSTEEAADAMMDSLREALQNPFAAAAFGNEPLAISIASSSRGSLQPLVQGSAAWQGRQAVLAATAPAEPLPSHPALMLPTQTLVKVTLHGSALCCFFFDMGVCSPCRPQVRLLCMELAAFGRDGGACSP